ncbi:MFS transporter [Pseudonocardia sp. MH-G8]|uniref:MFS transporter n=1 Tax=Pseudonocardia sp. MH-G8 TaxID=1854588 RepID=UPI000BA0942A|nr:MFS transporter [Pseudonocardia sp. MH-G8]OZM80865.1 MFS transporter [Pseudonocardia sp. MH-G8]
MSNDAIASPPDTTGGLTPGQLRTIVAACIGNFLEWYEFVLYGYFAAVFATLYFPQEDQSVGLMAAFLVFGISFVIRPIGGLFFGYVGDRFGRKVALSTIILMISFATALMGLVPPYAAIGVAAPVLIFLLRLVQGVSAGGEWMGAVAYIIETSPARRRAWYGSFQTITIVVGMLVAAVVSLLVTSGLDEEQVLAWGWRIPFLVALPLGLIGLYMRMKLAEPEEFVQASGEATATRSPLIAVLRHHWRSVLLVAGLVCSPTMCTYVLLVWGPTFFATELGYADGAARTIGLVGMVVLIGLVPLLARSCDRLGRRPFVLFGSLAVIVTTPIGFLLVHTGNTVVAVLGIALILLGDAMMLAAQPALFAELFPTAQRYSGLAIGYNLGVVLFGGLGPLVAQALVAWSGSSWSPAWYLMGGAVISLIAAVLTPETLGVRLRSGVVAEHA